MLKRKSASVSFSGKGQRTAMMKTTVRARRETVSWFGRFIVRPARRVARCRPAVAGCSQSRGGLFNQPRQLSTCNSRETNPKPEIRNPKEFRNPRSEEERPASAVDIRDTGGEWKLSVILPSII